MGTQPSENDPYWYRDAIIYEVHVRAFADSNGDGIGDFRGLTQKLDYLQDLGVTALWLLPFYPSPLRDDGYDIADYYTIHPDYGTLEDFREFVAEARARGLRVITELVINHTSDQHPWFQRARRAPVGHPDRDFYVWSATGREYSDVRIIFKDFEPSNWTLDRHSGLYYWHRFFSHQPDLNYDNPAVHQGVFDAMDFWFRMGVDGMRLDAIPYLYEREGTSSENLPETHDFLKKLREHVDANHTNRMLLAEANQWPEDAVAYFGSGDECHMSFHFPLMPRLFMAVQMEDRYPIVDILNQTPAIPESCQWALFLRNHDELTLEMVTDEERDYMYRMYAHDPRARINLGIRRRLAPLLGNNRRRIELLNALLLSMPGTPVLYYGDEIGMGDNIYLGDRNGVRTPMQWSSDRNAGFSRANPQQLYLPIIIDPEYHFEAVNVEAQQGNMHSLLWWMKRVIALRRQHRAFGRGSISFLHPENARILAFVRQYEDETILVVANLSRFVQYVELDLAPWQGQCPIELFGRSEFPKIGTLPYLLTLAPYAFYWFAIPSTHCGAEPAGTVDPPIHLRGSWSDMVEREAPELLLALRRFLQRKPWHNIHRRRQKDLQVRDVIRLEPAAREVALVLAEANFAEGESEVYALPLGRLSGPAAAAAEREAPEHVVARIEGSDSPAVLVDALMDRDTASAILALFDTGDRLEGDHGALTASRGADYIARRGEGHLEPQFCRRDFNNTSMIYGNRLYLKFLRRVEEGLHPEIELGLKLGPAGISPRLLGVLEYRSARQSMALGVMMEFIEHQGDAMALAIAQATDFGERTLLETNNIATPEIPKAGIVALAALAIPAPVREAVGLFIEQMHHIGERTAEMHLCLAGDADDKGFTTEPFTPFYQRGLFQSMRNRLSHVELLLRRHRSELPEASLAAADRLAEVSPLLLGRIRSAVIRRMNSRRIRIHGDYRLDQLLFTGRDFVVVDLEGDVARSLTERSIRRSPLRDVASLIRSLHRAAHRALGRFQEQGLVTEATMPKAEEAFAAWEVWCSVAFLQGYLARVAPANLLPHEGEALQGLLDAYLVERRLTEVETDLRAGGTELSELLAGIVREAVRV